MSLSAANPTRAPVHSLPGPAELLVDVMEDVGDPVLVTAVCSHWRHFTLSTARLWTHIEVQDIDVYAAVAKTQAFAARSGNLPLHIHRRDNRAPDIDLELVVGVLNQLLISLFSRCASFAYVRAYRPAVRRSNSDEIPPLLDETSWTFVATLLSCSAPRLRSFTLEITSFEFRVSDDDRGDTVFDLAVNWPLLTELDISACLPLWTLKSPALKTLTVYPQQCDWECQNAETFSVDLGALTRASPSLQVLDVQWTIGELLGERLLTESYALLGDLLQPQVRDVRLNGVHVSWFSPPNNLHDRTLHLPNLAYLALAGNGSRPGFCEEERGTLAVQELIYLLEAAPNLVNLYISDWDVPVVVPDLSSLMKVPLNKLESVRFRWVEATWCKHILGAMIAPHLRELDLALGYWEPDDESNCELFVPSSTLPWSFPELEDLEINFLDEHVAPPAYAGTEIPALLRNGNFPRLKTLNLGENTHGFIHGTCVDDIVRVLSDSHVAPSLETLTMTDCDRSGEDDYSPDSQARNKQTAEEMAHYLNSMRRGEGDHLVVPPITIQYARCFGCSDHK
ncbi:hypothetical protein EXIGLDRAFT_759870 [Exidia glandulosa HHB12029]|uniref:F-box domain-containing protein n=1 Tax=Exidia glandulosa HHB12029 TaxID=1314781 RepID=A0A165PM41_EXIGL|nr:hypothetical protein EXIGLDRAFT_759870 [Exidia glandulosa HHB12029]